MNIFVVILTYNGYQDTSSCLKSLPILLDRSYRLHTVLVDNGSKQKELSALKLFLSRNKSIVNECHIKLLENGKNLGFAKGNNAGIRYSLDHEADFILLLNNDTIIEMNFLSNLLKLNEAISSPVVKFREFKDKPKMMYDLGGFVNWWTGRTYHINAYKEDLNKYTGKGPLEAEYVAGCCMLIRRDVFDAIGLLDEKYFIYFEDVDFCISAEKKGFKVIVDPKSVIYHKLGGSMDRWSKRAIYRNLLGNLIFITKHLGWRRLSGFAYLAGLTSKIIKDKIMDDYNRKWRGARRTL